MKSKGPSSPADGDRAAGANEDDSIDDSLNQILAEVEPNPGVSSATRPPEALASMSGPALVDDVKEEHTDIESLRPTAAAASAAEKALLSGGEDVITGENVGFFSEPKSAGRITDDGEGTMSLGPIAGSEQSLAEQSREERERVLRRSRPPTPATPRPRLRDRENDGDSERDEAQDPELEVGALDYGRQRPSPSPSDDDEDDDDGPGGRPAGDEPRASDHGSDAPALRATLPLYPSTGSGSGRHSLPPPATRRTPTAGHARLPTPKPGVQVSVTPSPRISSPGIPISVGAGALGPAARARPPSAVFSKVQLPLGGLVTMVGAAFGVGLILGALLWRGAAEPPAEVGGHAAAEGKVAPVSAGTEPAAPKTPAATASAPAAVPAAEPTPAALAPTPAPPVPAEAIAPAVSAPAAEVPPPPSLQASAPGPKEPSKKVASATPKTARGRKAAAASSAETTDGQAKAKNAAWVDPFAQ